jgi:hypothetical protein
MILSKFESDRRGANRPQCRDDPPGRLYDISSLPFNSPFFDRIFYVNNRKRNPTDVTVLIAETSFRF